MTPEDHSRIAGLYDWLTRQPDLSAAVQGLTSRSVRELSGYCYTTLQASENNAAGIIFGHLINEAFTRFLKMKDPSPPQAAPL